MSACLPEMTQTGTVLLTGFAIVAGLCLWLYWRQRNENVRLAAMLHFRTMALESAEAAVAIHKAMSALDARTEEPKK